jgi:hypothetical protein
MQHNKNVSNGDSALVAMVKPALVPAQKFDFAASPIRVMGQIKSQTFEGGGFIKIMSSTIHRSYELYVDSF